MAPLRIGVIGGGNVTEEWIAAVVRRADAQLVAVSDRDAQRAAPVAARHQAAFEPDARALLMQHVPDAVIVALSPAGADKLLPAAAERGVAVLLDSPPARTLDEAVHRDRMFDRAGLPLLVASGWRCDPALDVCRSPTNGLGRLVQGVLTVAAPMPNPPGWRGDRLRGGGGVLMEAAYDPLDAMIAAMGLPADVLFHTLRANRADGPVYDTEDLAGGIMRFAEGLVATVSARWGAPPHGSTLQLAGRLQTAVIDPQRVVIHAASDDCGAAPAREPPTSRQNSPPDAPAAGEHSLARDPRPRQEVALEHLLEAVRAARASKPTARGDNPPRLMPDRPAPGGPPPAAAQAAPTTESARDSASPAGQAAAPRRTSFMRDHFAVLAVLEAAYLSDRTGEPEPPHQVFERCGLSAP